MSVQKNPSGLFYIVAAKLSFVKSVEMNGPCLCVTYHQNELYAGVVGGIDVIRGYKSASFIEVDSQFVHCVKFYNEHTYVLLFQPSKNTWSIHVYNDRKSLLHSWKHSDSNTNPNKFVIFDEKMYIPSRGMKRILSYSLKGELIGKGIPIEEVNGLRGFTAICMMERCLAFSCSSPSLVICIDVKTKKRIWSITDLKKPIGITTDRSGYLIICTGGTSTLCLEVLHPDTGELFCSHKSRVPLY